MRVGVVGHRFLSAEAAAFAEGICAHLFAELRRGGNGVTALSALAEGADTLFARVAVSSGVPLAVVRPHGQYLDDFGTHRAQVGYLLMTTTAHDRTLMPFRSRCDVAYEAAMRWVADRSDVLVAIWDGRPSSYIGGTARTVRYARASGRQILHVHPDARWVARV